jgi:hypothetical protein
MMHSEWVFRSTKWRLNSDNTKLLHYTRSLASSIHLPSRQLKEHSYAVVTECEVLFWHLPRRAEENHKNLSQDSQSPGRDLNPGTSDSSICNQQIHELLNCNFLTGPIGCHHHHKSSSLSPTRPSWIHPHNFLRTVLTVACPSPLIKS